MERFVQLLRDDGGATMAEYALVVSLVAMVCIVAVAAVGQATSSVMFQKIADSL
ncbi:MAG TPA: Flp family type IVb pilin [Candidatus Tumulicola sp.]|jgi:Flp pilus assembly pilin Flp